MFRYRDIKAKVRKQPFAPFRITTSAGETFEVYHPEMILVGRRDIQIGSPIQEDPTVYDDVTRVAILHITSLKDIPVRRRKNGNGRRNE